MDDEEALIQELNDLREFVNNNKECIEDFFQIKRDGKQGPDENENHEDSEEETPEEAARRIKQRELKALMDEGKKKENEAAMKMTD